MVDDAVKFAEESPEPDPAELYTDVYVDRSHGLTREERIQREPGKE